MIKKNNKEVGFIEKGTTNIDKIYKGTNLVFEQGFIREDSGSTPLTTSHEAIGKDLKNYKVYGKSRQSNLPEGYTEIEYIRGDGSGYIPTNIYLNGDDIVKIKFKTLSSNIAFCLFGSYKANESDNFSVYIQSTYDSFFRYGDINYRQLKASPNTIYEIEMCANYLKINDEIYYPFATQTFTTRYPIYIGHINSSSSPKLKGIIYNFEIVGKARLLSCTRNSDGQIGMYDVMNNNFYPATGTLTAGTNVVPSPNYPIPIESVGDLVTDSSDTNYGKYKIPVSDGTDTTNMYLNEPLRKVGNYADYIDYKEQKVYRNVIVNDDSGEQTIENSYFGTTDTTGTSVTLPNIPSLVGTTIYDVDTKVKPSNMYIKYKGR